MNRNELLKSNEHKVFLIRMGKVYDIHSAIVSYFYIAVKSSRGEIAGTRVYQKMSY